MKFSRFLILTITCLMFVGINGVDAQVFGKKKKKEVVEEESMETGEDGATADELIDEEDLEASKKKVSSPKMIGLPARDAFAEKTWSYYQTAKEITRLVEFVNVEIIDVEGEGEDGATSEMRITTAEGKPLSVNNALKQLQSLQQRLKKHQIEAKQLDVLQEATKNEKVPMKLTAKAMGQNKDTLKLKSLAITEIGKTLGKLGKNIATIIKMNKK